MKRILLFFLIHACATVQWVSSQTCSDNIDIKQLQEYLDNTSRMNYNNSTSILTFRPSQSLQGFGNLMVGAYGMILISQAQAAVPLLAHAMVASMFDHPLSEEGLYFQRLLEDPDGTITLPDVVDSGPENIRNGAGKVSFVNVLGTGDNLKKKPMKELYGGLLNMSSTDPRLYDVMSSTAAQWMLSKPSHRFQQIYNTFKTQKLAECSSGHFDFGIQIRTWKDWTSYYSFFEKNIDCVVECISFIMEEKIRRKGFEVDNPPCVFITSDSKSDSESIIKKLTLRLDETFPSLNTEFVTSTTPLQTHAEIEHSNSYKRKTENDKPFSWRSDFVLRTSRQNFNIKDLSKRTDLLDWMLFGEVDLGNLHWWLHIRTYGTNANGLQSTGSGSYCDYSRNIWTSGLCMQSCATR